MNPGHDEETHDLRVRFAELSGQLQTVIAQMGAGDKQVEQLVTLVKDQLTFHAAELGELKQVVREAAIRTEQSMNAIRQDLEKRIDEKVLPVDSRIGEHTTQIAALRTEVDHLRLWKARIGGIAVAAALLGSATSAVVIKAIGA